MRKQGIMQLNARPENSIKAIAFNSWIPGLRPE